MVLFVNWNDAAGKTQFSWRKGEPKANDPWQQVESIQADGDELEIIIRRFPNINQFVGGKSTIYVSDDARFIYANLLMECSP